MKELPRITPSSSHTLNRYYTYHSREMGMIVEAVRELQEEEIERQEHYRRAWEKGNAATEYNGEPRSVTPGEGEYRKGIQITPDGVRVRMYTIAELREKLEEMEADVSINEPNTSWFLRWLENQS